MRSRKNIVPAVHTCAELSLYSTCDDLEYFMCVKGGKEEINPDPFIFRFSCSKITHLDINIKDLEGGKEFHLNTAINIEQIKMLHGYLTLLLQSEQMIESDNHGL